MLGISFEKINMRVVRVINKVVIWDRVFEDRSYPRNELLIPKSP